VLSESEREKNNCCITDGLDLHRLFITYGENAGITQALLNPALYEVIGQLPAPDTLPPSKKSPVLTGAGMAQSV
jgi:hypothetical protein